MTNELLTQQQLADELQVSLRTLERWRQEGTGPAFIRVSRSPATSAPTSTPGWTSNAAREAGRHRSTSVGNQRSPMNRKA
jgi:hypothetical protein